MSSSVVLDETRCGALCQHPGCWYSERRIVRQTPHTGIRDERVDGKERDEYSGLPTQTVVNLLDDYGEDANDRYPSKPPEKPSKSGGGESLARVRTPRATPSSPLRSTVQGHSAASQVPKGPKPLKQIEVQEVFDIYDLRNDWQQTFHAKKYYVWVPNAKKKKKTAVKQQYNTEQSLQPKHSVQFKDVTRELVPDEIERQRKAAVIHNDVWPVLKKRPRKQPASFWKSIPYYYPDCHCESPRPRFHQPAGKYYGVYDLLDLPKDVLTQIMQHITERELLDRQKFAEALIRILPQLEKNSTAISMAYSDVLRQYPVILKNKKPGDETDKSEFTKPVFQMDDHVPLDMIADTEDRAAQKSRLSAHSGRASAAARDYAASGTMSPGNSKKPLPSIPFGRGMPTKAPPSTAREPSGQPDTADSMKKRVPNISLGLPEIPSGNRATKSFTYQRNAEKNFTLAPVVSATPPASYTQVTSRNSSACSDAPVVSTVHVTVPILTSERDEFKTPSQSNKGGQEASAFGSESEKIAELTLARDSTTAKLPKTPVNTPNMIMTEPSFITPEISSGALDAIQEHNADVPPGSALSDQPMSRETASRSVRFSVKTPEAHDQVMNDDDGDDYDAERNMSPLPVKKQLSFINNDSSVEKRTALSASESRDLVVIGQGTQPQPTPPSRQRSKQHLGGSITWPYIEAGPTSASSPVQSSQGAASVNILDMTADESAVATYDGASEQSGITGMMPRSTAPSRESSIHSEQVKRMWHEGKLPQSPAPPPPSPTGDILPDLAAAEGYQPVPPSTPLTAKDNPHLSILKEVTETDSEITITAPPPSNLDDFSRINTPNSIVSAPRGLMSRENTGLTGVPRVDTVPELSESKSTIQEPWSVGQDQDLTATVESGQNSAEWKKSEAQENQEAPLDETTGDNTGNTLNVHLGGEPPHIDMDQVSTISGNVDENPARVQEGRLDYMLTVDTEQDNTVEDPDHNQETKNEMENETNNEMGNTGDENPSDFSHLGGSPPQIDGDQLGGLDDMNVAGSAYSPLQPALTNYENRQISDDGQGNEEKDMLDKFDATEESLKEELKEELEKF